MISTIIYAVLFFFVFYPVVGGMFWIGGSLYYHFRVMGKLPTYPEGEEEPFISIMLPCHNEEAVIERTLNYLDNHINYTNYEIIAVDDASTDSTPDILAEWQKTSKHLRVVRIEENKGKAHGITQAAFYAKGEYLLCIDADSFVVGDTLQKMVSWFMVDSLFSPAARVGAVTGAPTPVNRSTLLAKLQYVEYNSIIGMVKRAQSVVGRIFTVSGVCVMYRRDAIVSVGYWDQTKITEDIAVSWALQLKGWRIQYASDAQCYMQVPEKVKVLFKQRQRWAQGGVEVFAEHTLFVLRHPVKTFPFIILWTDQFVSIMWSVFWAITMLVAGLYLLINPSYEKTYSFFVFSCIAVAYEFIVGSIQLFVSLYFNRYSKGTLKYFLFAGWYTWGYWILSPTTLISALPKAVRSIIVGGSGTWTSPKREEA